MRNVAVYGVGTTTFALEPGRTSTAMVAAATREALADAGIDRIDARLPRHRLRRDGRRPACAPRRGHRRGPDRPHRERVRERHHGIPRGVGRGRGRALRARAGNRRRAHVQRRGAIPPEPRDPEGATGLALPALYAMSASHYAAAHGVTDRELAAVAVKNRRHGAANPRAQHPSPVTEDEVLRSRMIAEPLTRLQCSSISDGAGAAVLGPGARRSPGCPDPRLGDRQRRALGLPDRPRLGLRDRRSASPTRPTSRPASASTTSTCSRCTTRSRSARS